MSKGKDKVENNRNRVVNVRLTISEYKAVQKYLKAKGQNKISPFIRAEILAKINPLSNDN